MSRPHRRPPKWIAISIHITDDKKCAWANPLAMTIDARLLVRRSMSSTSHIVTPSKPSCQKHNDISFIIIACFRDPHASRGSHPVQTTPDYYLGLSKDLNPQKDLIHINPSMTIRPRPLPILWNDPRTHSGTIFILQKGEEHFAFSPSLGRQRKG